VLAAPLRLSLQLDVGRHLTVALNRCAASYTDSGEFDVGKCGTLRTELCEALHPSHCGGKMADLPDQKEAGEPNEQLVKVFDTEQESEAMVVRGLLEANGIPAVIENLDAPQDVLPGVGGVIVLVRAEQGEEAGRLIAESRTDLPDDETVSEEQV
jgi:hypothetical protein